VQVVLKARMAELTTMEILVLLQHLLQLLQGVAVSDTRAVRIQVLHNQVDLHKFLTQRRPPEVAEVLVDLEVQAVVVQVVQVVQEVDRRQEAPVQV
jgi:hypothetical protein